MSAELHSQIETDFISHHAADDIAIAECEEALETAETCVSMLKNETVQALGMTPQAFDAWFGKEFAPTDAQLRDEDGDFAARGADAVLEAAGRLPISQRIKLVDSLMERNTADVMKPYDPTAWGHRVASL